MRRVSQILVVGIVGVSVPFITLPASANPSNFLELDNNIVKDNAGIYDWANSGTLISGMNVPTTWTRSGSGGIFDGGV